VLTLDETVRAWVWAMPRPAALDWLMLAASTIGTRALIWLILGAATAIVRPERAGGVWQLTLAIVLCSLAVDGVLKPGIARDRPFIADATRLVLGDRPSTTSFPSGHAATAVAGAYVLSRVWSRGRAWLWALAAIILFSRVYVGVHYPIDVLAGALVGWASAALAVGGTVWYSQVSATRTPTVPR